MSGFTTAVSGFTMVELVAVLVLLGVLSAVAFGRLVSPSAFAPSIVVQAVVSQAAFAQQLAANRRDAVVTLTVARSGDDWQFDTSTDIDGLIRSESIEISNTILQADSGAASDTIDAATSLVIEFDSAGYLADVDVGAAAGDPTLGVDLTVSGDSSRAACIYPSGYATDAACS